MTLGALRHCCIAVVCAVALALAMGGPVAAQHYGGHGGGYGWHGGGGYGWHGGGGYGWHGGGYGWRGGHGYRGWGRGWGGVYVAPPPYSYYGYAPPPYYPYPYVPPPVY